MHILNLCLVINAKDMSKVKKYKAPKGFEKAWEAGIKALEDSQNE